MERRHGLAKCGGILGAGRAFVCEALPQFRREPKVGMISHTRDPAMRHLSVRDAIEGGVDLDRIEKMG
jgi:hypothetical protein